MKAQPLLRSPLKSFGVAGFSLGPLEGGTTLTILSEDLGDGNDIGDGVCGRGLGGWVGVRGIEGGSGG